MSEARGVILTCLGRLVGTSEWQEYDVCSMDEYEDDYGICGRCLIGFGIIIIIIRKLD